ncbi:hypothetical protein [Pseudomonas sp. NFACC37-1]|uniref:hypothetical protein n=1 Tax=Pseudomonas sp. NFACC37-1 TaxID=1566196 RepID=UPI00087F1AAF|nr:hypothetical protein [Pseudomonas sp. NFACC37-1]SCY35774.1 hypothetical protein SAMN03159391_01611 [Pseudomonas sp. NFACC37-1]
MLNPLSYIDALQVRDVSFKSVRNALKNHDLPVSTGWQQTVAKIIPELKKKDTKDACAASLVLIHNEMTLYCDKVVKIYEVDAGLINLLIGAMSKGFVDKGSVYTKGFPFPLALDELLKAPLDIICAAQWDEKDRSNFMMCSKQYITEREELPGDSLDDDATKDFGVFDELIGIRRRPIQLYDVVSLLPDEGLIEIRLDGVKKFNADDISRRMRRIEQLVSQFAAKNIGTPDILGTKLNFYPAIKKLYDTNDGVVGELGHVTDAAGIYREKMRHKSRDVRLDPYHHGGTVAVVDLNAYSISKHWPSPAGNGEPEISIPAHFSIASDKNPVIDILHVLNCTSQEDYDFVLDKVL